ncbi:sigma-54 dependent transcriptional regulator [Deltaproteobacteria bacterium TL4]
MTKSVLIATKNNAAIDTIKTSLEDEYKVFSTSNLEDCLLNFHKKRQEYTFLDISLINQFLGLEKCQENDYKKLLQKFWKSFPTAPVVILSPQSLLRDAVHMVKAGATDYLSYPVDPIEIKHVLDSTAEFMKIKSELGYLRNEFWKQEHRGVVKTNNKTMQLVFDTVQKVAPTQMTILISGETGTGKGIIAKLIHNYSNRSDKPFVHVHCGAIADSLLESELFGHEKGAFTHAFQRKLGKFEIANGGTIFLDEVGTMTPSAQIKLLQVLQDKMFQRVGGSVDIKVDIRVIAASNADLKQLSEEGKFRSDLYYRLNVFSIHIPPLRERREDIALLVDEFLKRYNQHYPKSISGMSPDVEAAFDQYGWPGNIRELENIIERAFILESSSVLTPESLPHDLISSDEINVRLPVDTGLNLAKAREKAVDNFERQYLKELLAAHQGRINNSAQTAGITTRQLHRMLSKYGINKEEFKVLVASKKSSA